MFGDIASLITEVLSPDEVPDVLRMVSAREIASSLSAEEADTRGIASSGA